MTTAKAIDFYLPDELNASHPPEKRGLLRDRVRMMVLDRVTGEIRHDQFFNLEKFLMPGDLLILNNSRTIPGVIYGEWFRHTVQLASKVEIRLARRRSEDTWEALVVANLIKIGDRLIFSPELFGTVVGEKANSPLKLIQFTKKGTELFNDIYSLGDPVRYEYIEHPWELDYYQTVFASHPGSVEMPSAGRAFSWEMLFKMRQKGVRYDFLRLHTGLSYLLDDQILPSPEDNEEEYEIPVRTMKRIIETKTTGNRIIAVGTTVVRALETAAKNGKLGGITNLYIDPHFPLKIADGIITGLHEPQASHLDMLSAFVSQDHLLNAYHQAIEMGYLWHEFGDMNLIL